MSRLSQPSGCGSGRQCPQLTLQLRTSTAAGSAGLLAGFDPANSYSWKLATTSGGVTGFDPAAFQMDRSGFANAASGAFSVRQIGNDLYLNYAAVPEPSTWLLVSLGLAGILLRRGRVTRPGRTEKSLVRRRLHP